MTVRLLLPPSQTQGNDKATDPSSFCCEAFTTEIKDVFQVEVGKKLKKDLINRVSHECFYRI